MLSHRHKLLCALRAGACSLVALLFAITTIAQTNQKMIVRRLTLLKYPLELSTDYKNKPVDAKWNVFPESGFRTQVFEADSDWLRNITFRLKNVSDKKITYIHRIGPIRSKALIKTASGRVAADWPSLSTKLITV